MKRFTETNKWKDAWYVSIGPYAKLLLSYIYDNCDEAGFIDVITATWMYDTKIPTREAFTIALLELQPVLVSSKPDKKLWLSIFLRQEQKLPLNPKQPEDKYIIEKLTRQLEKFGSPKEMVQILQEATPQKGGKKAPSQKNFVAPTRDEFFAEYKKQKPDADVELEIVPCYNHYFNVDWCIGKTNKKMKSLEKLIESAIARNKQYEKRATTKQSGAASSASRHKHSSGF